ncbi:MAG: hypothetical protein HOO06_16100 [Bdellovibrionaceae bacterium]|jgi:predicted SnoaL-like aldol condensation-catalyzing enzyme|nr:hypothetical protein [Pseudobdellovibrionaceae bacterium]
MDTMRKQKIYNLLKGIETGDPNSVKVVNEDKYIQHNPQTHEGGEGLAQLFDRLSKTNPKVKIVRLFEDGDFVFGHTIYDFSSVRIGFEIFRYEGDYVVEHWDNIQPRVGTMVEGSTEVFDLDLTEDNREVVQQLMNQVFVKKQLEKIINFVNVECFINHSPLLSLAEKIKNMDYKKVHRILAEGNFVLTVAEGYDDTALTSFYDLFRVEDKKIVEHWDTTEKVPPKINWKNDNGKF